MKNSYNITILGQELSVLSDSEDDQVTEVVQFLNKKVDEILHSGNGLKDIERCHPGGFKHFRGIDKIKRS